MNVLHKIPFSSSLSLFCENRLEYRMTAEELSRKSNVVPFGGLSESNTHVIRRAWFTRFFERTDRFIAKLSLLKRETICSWVKRGTPLFSWISLDEFVWMNFGNVSSYKFYLRLRCEEILEKWRTLTEFECCFFSILITRCSWTNSKEYLILNVCFSS